MFIKNKNKKVFTLLLALLMGTTAQIPIYADMGYNVDKVVEKTIKYANLGSKLFGGIGKAVHPVIGLYTGRAIGTVVGGVFGGTKRIIKIALGRQKNKGPEVKLLEEGNKKLIKDE